MMSWLKLIRWPNLLIIFLTQVTVWVVVIRQLSWSSNFLLTPVNFLCLSLATVLIAAAGYVINDYFDVKIDTINRPDKVVLGKTIPRKNAIVIHAILNAVALFLSAFVAMQAGHPEWLLLQIGCILLLWRYSTHFKRQYMIGNIVVSAVTALAVPVLVLYEPAFHALCSAWAFTADPHLFWLPWVIAGFTYFAFFLNWMREIVKDMEDFIGDAQEGCVTMPIKKGLGYSKRFTTALGVLVVMPLAGIVVLMMVRQYFFWGAYWGAVVLVPLLVWMFRFGGSTTIQDFHRASRGLKWIMITGVVALIALGIKNGI
jgi:4-hydroxybenzoate polyprenyltransferase